MATKRKKRTKATEEPIEAPSVAEVSNAPAPEAPACEPPASAKRASIAPPFDARASECYLVCTTRPMSGFVRYGFLLSEKPIAIPREQLSEEILEKMRANPLIKVEG
jgi:hypothetical protein